jgi:hypothetical protein
MVVDSGEGIAGDLDGNSYVTGNSSGNWGAPIRPFTADSRNSSDAFVVKLPANPLAQPEITSLSPPSVLAGGLDFSLTVQGFNFVDGSIVRWDGADRPTTFISNSEVIATIGAGDITVAKTVQISARNPDGEISLNSMEFTIVPSLTALVPSNATVGDTGFTLIVTGSAFVDGTTVKWDGADRPTTFFNSSQVNATIGAADLTVAKVVNVTVRNPSGGISNALVFRVNNRAPSLTALVPSSATAGDLGFILAVTGSDFRNGATVMWGGGNRTTILVNSYEVNATIGANDIAIAGTVQVTVQNTDLQSSNALGFTISQPLPTIISLSPNKATGGGTGFTMTIIGTNFVSGSIVKWNGAEKATTYISPIELHATILAGDIAVGGEIQVAVVNPIPAGSTSNAITFPVSSFTMNSSPASTTVNAGQSAAYAIQVIPQFSSFDSPVTFTTTGLPRNSTASITPASVIPGANTAAVALNIATRANTASAAGAKFDPGGVIPPALGILLAIQLVMGLFAFHNPILRKRCFHLISVIALVCMVGMIASCGAGGDNNPPPNNGTPPGTYQITVQGESGSLKTSTTMTLVVN